MSDWKAQSEKMKAAHKVLAIYDYTLRPVQKGYANRTLYINLENNIIKEKPVTQQMKDLFTGGRGFALWLLWNAVMDNTKWNDPENEVIFANGPICGSTAYPGLGKSTVVTVSPLTKSIMDSNGGGYFAPYLKFSGFDALEIQGKAKEDVIIFIDGDSGHVTIETTPLEPVNTHLLIPLLAGMYSESERSKRGISTATTGQGAEHVLYSGLNLSWYDVRLKEMRIKQAARGGAGRVFRDKKVKAIVVKFSNLTGDQNNPADAALVRKAGRRINKEIADFDDKQNQMRVVGTAHLIEIMDHFNLLPVDNYRFGSHPESYKIDAHYWRENFSKNSTDSCWAGCSLSCAHDVEHFHLQTGPYAGGIVTVDGPEYETLAGLGSNIGVFDPLAVLELNFYADTYGIDTISLANSIAFIMECYQEGILNKERTSGVELTWGNAEAALELLHQMARGEGFGKIVGLGVRQMKEIFAREYGADPKFLQDIGMEVKGMEISEYVTKESLAQQGGYAMAIKGAQHDEAWLIFMDQINNQLPTFEAKAEALHYFPLWRTWFSVHGLCKLPWNDILPADNAKQPEPQKVPEHVENYTWLHEGVTGIKVTPADLLRQSEKVYNLQRLFALRLGFGTRKHDYPPYRAMGPVTVAEYQSRAELYDKQLREMVGVSPDGLSTEEKIAHLRKFREGRYEQLLDTVYKRRGWNANGIPTLEKLQELGIDIPELVSQVKRATAST